MTYNKKKMLSCGVILISVLLAYICRLARPENVFMRNIADQCRNCIYLGIYCAWVIYLEKHVVHKKMRRCLTAIGCLMVFWFFVRTVKFHILHDPLGEHVCWYLYYIPMILIPVLGLAAAMFFGEKDEEKTVRRIKILLTVAVVLIVSVFTNDLHQMVFHFAKQPPFSDNDYSYGILFMVIQGWMLICLTGMEIILIRKSRIPGKKQFWLPIIPGILLLGWNIGNIFRLPFIQTFAGDMTAVCCLLMAAIYQGCILCGLIQTNNRYFELFQTSGGLDAEITDYSFQRYYHSGDFPQLSPELRSMIVNRSFVQEQGIRINHIPIRGGHLFWSEDISVLLDQYQDIREQQEELIARNRLLKKTYQKEAERRKAEEQNRLLNMIQSQTAGQLELLSQLMDELEKTESRERYNWILGKIVVVGTYLKRRKNLVLTQYTSDGNLLTMEDLRQSIAESCDSLKLCKIRAAYYVESGDVQLNADDILKCYDTFEWLVEQLSDVMHSIFYRVSQIDEDLRISVHIVSEADLRDLVSERPELKVQQEDENEWFVGCIVLRKGGSR
ncbi:histidine kinase N-terminal 7TM domain-containing protein [Blautia sp. 1033sp1_1033st1_G9_1033SCRN_220408]|uniref:histidine kinase N-terminal 7TM domain-containing protein n=1 Tax=Blautia sp. 1033sp1_1033st1_G9_1033SCRN_220408 TaxID=3144490 RepID=UPI0034A3EF5C